MPDVYNIALAEPFDELFVFGQLQSENAGAHTSRGYRVEYRQGFFFVNTARLVTFPRFGFNKAFQR